MEGDFRVPSVLSPIYTQPVSPSFRFYRKAVGSEERNAQIAQAGAVPLLVMLLSAGTQEGRSYAAGALWALAGGCGKHGWKIRCGKGRLRYAIWGGSTSYTVPSSAKVSWCQLSSMVHV